MRLIMSLGPDLFKPEILEQRVENDHDVMTWRLKVRIGH